MRKRHTTALLGALSALAGAGFVRWQLERWFTPSTPYELERRADGFEVRRYPALVRAETEVYEATWRDALREGFRRLASYIFGQNRALLGMAAIPTAGEGVAVTVTPPLSTPGTRGEKIAMTTPVMSSATETRSAAEVSPFTVSFVMPSERSVGSLPAPVDERVMLRDVPARRVAAMRYAGRAGVERTLRKGRELLARVAAEGLRPVGEPLFAAYDPPWTLPFLRRNEVWVEVE